LFQYKINNLSEDLEKKLLLYSVDNLKERYEEYFNTERYIKFVDIIINQNNLNIEEMIDDLEEYYKSGISLKENKLHFNSSEVHMICSQLYKKLYNINTLTAFMRYLEIIQTKVYGGFNWWLDIYFDNADIKNNFLDNATNYIIKHQNKVWVTEFSNIDYTQHSWLPKIDNIPEIFDNNSQLYFWLKDGHHNRKDEILHFIGNSLINYLLWKVIKFESYNTHQIDKNRILNILDSCKNDYITIGYILTSNDIRLNIFLLTQFEYSLFAFLNLYNIDASPNQLSDEDTDYTKEWQEMLSNQLVNIFFKHFHNVRYKKKFNQIIFKLINYLVVQYVYQYNNTRSYKSNYTLSLIFEKLVNFKIQVSHYEKISLFNFIIEDLVKKQLLKLKEQNIFSHANYFLLSYYLKQIEIENKIIDKDYSSLIDEITQSIQDNLYEAINDDAYILIDYAFIEKIDFGLMYILSSTNTSKLKKLRFITSSKILSMRDFQYHWIEFCKKSNIWLKLIEINEIEEKWKSILESKKEKTTISSADPKEPRDRVELYFYILLMIFDKTGDKEVAKIINELAIKFGLDFEFGIFMDFSVNLYDKYLEKLNIFDDDLFDIFLIELSKQKNIKNLLQLFSHTISKARKEKIEGKIELVVQSVKKESMSYFDIRESISYALYNDFPKLASILIEAYKIKIASTNYKHKEFDEIVCRKELLDIYYSDDYQEDKLKRLNLYKITFDDKGWGNNSKQVQCENYKDFIRAIIFFEAKPAKPDKTYKILLSLLGKEINALYLINMVSAYFEMNKSDINKKEKFDYILKEYQRYEQKLHNHKKSLHEYQILFYGYLTIKDENEIMRLWQEMPKQYQYDFRILELRCEFLQEINQSSKAKEYIRNFKKIYTLSDDEKVKIEKIEDELNTHIKIQTENELNVKIDFQSNYLTLQEAKKYWLQIKNMSSEEHAQIFSNKQNLNNFIIEIMLNISKELLNRTVNIKRQQNEKLEIEDIINDWVTSLLGQKMSFLNWSVRDQKRSGKSASGKNVGETDLETYNANNEKLFLFEAFRLSSVDTTTISEHINKLDGYNPDGSQIIILMVYTKVKDFVELCKKYEKFLQTFEYKGFDKLSSLSKHSFEEMVSNSSNIKLLKEVRYKNGKEMNLYHYLLDFE